MTATRRSPLLPLLLLLAPGFDYTPPQEDKPAKLHASPLQPEPYRPELPPPLAPDPPGDFLTGPAHDAVAAWRASPNDEAAVQAARERIANLLDIGGSDIWLTWAELERAWAPIALDRAAAALATGALPAPVSCAGLRGKTLTDCEAWNEDPTDTTLTESFAKRVAKAAKKGGPNSRFANAHLQHLLANRSKTAVDTTLYDAVQGNTERMAAWTALQKAMAQGTAAELDPSEWPKDVRFAHAAATGGEPMLDPMWDSLTGAVDRASSTAELIRALQTSIAVSTELGHTERAAEQWKKLAEVEGEHDAIVYANLVLATTDDREPPVKAYSRAVEQATGELGRITRIGLGWSLLAVGRSEDAATLAQKAGESDESALLAAWAGALNGDEAAIIALHGERPEEPVQQVGWAAEVCATRAKMSHSELQLEVYIPSNDDGSPDLPATDDSPGATMLYECLQQLYPEEPPTEPYVLAIEILE